MEKKAISEIMEGIQLTRLELINTKGGGDDGDPIDEPSLPGEDGHP